MHEDQKKILIVDDDSRNIFALKAVLHEKGFGCLSAISISEALATLALNNDIGVILMDMMMPDLDGYEGIAKVREYGYLMPVIAVTAQAMTGDREKCIKAGARDYVSKPVNIDSLIEKLNVYLK